MLCPMLAFGRFVKILLHSRRIAPYMTHHASKLLTAIVALFALATTLPAFAEQVSVTRFTGPDENHHSYFINGLASAIPSVGYALRDLSDELRGRHYAYVTPVESTVPVQISVIADINKRLRANPRAKINLIGVSYGGNIATLIAQQLHLRKIPVNYLAVIDAPAPVAITANVHRVDNFYCRHFGCIGQKVPLAWGNKSTIRQQFRVRENHIAISASPVVRDRITGQLSEVAMNLTNPKPPQSLLGYDQLLATDPF